MSCTVYYQQAKIEVPPYVGMQLCVKGSAMKVRTASNSTAISKQLLQQQKQFIEGLSGMVLAENLIANTSIPTTTTAAAITAAAASSTRSPLKSSCRRTAVKLTYHASPTVIML